MEEDKDAHDWSRSEAEEEAKEKLKKKAGGNSVQAIDMSSTGYLTKMPLALKLKLKPRGCD